MSEDVIDQLAKLQRRNSSKALLLAEFVRKNPGKNAVELLKIGLHWPTHGSFRRAQDAGLITWRNEGLYVVENADA